MGFFAYPFLVTFDDTMAYGTHHFMTNFKFQCAARESLIFGNIAGESYDWRSELADILMLTREGYTRNMSPVSVGEKVVVLMTFEEPSISSVRLCFRTLDKSGQAVACGYQTIVCVDKNTSGLAELPNIFTQFQNDVEETFSEPNFEERARTGGRLCDELFTVEAVEFAKHFVTAPAAQSYPQIVSTEQLSKLIR